MSAPTPAPGDDRPREGYYPDPSIPGYVRYWNGTAWVPGTSRPAPKEGEHLAPPPGVRPAPPAVEETGPHFFDEDPVDGPAAAEDARHGGGPEPASAWTADRSRQAGLGADQERRVRWGSPEGADPRVAHGGEAGSASGSSPAEGASGGDFDGGDSGSTFVFRRPTAASAGGSGGTGAATPDGPAVAGAAGAGAVSPAPGGQTSGPTRADEGTMTFRPAPARVGQQGGRATGDGSGAPGFGAGQSAAGRAADGQAAGQVSPAAQAAAPQAGAQGSPSAHAAAAQGSAAVAPPGPQQVGPSGPQQVAPSGPQQVGSSGPQQVPPSGPQQVTPALTPQAAHAVRPQVAPALPQQVAPPHHPAPQPVAPAAQAAPVTPAAAVAAAAPAPAAPTPLTSGPGGGQSSWAQQVHRLAGAGGDEQQPVTPWRPPADDPFQAMVRQQTAARPAPLGKRLAARLLDTVVLGAVTAVAAVPLGARAVDHVDRKIEAARLSGETVTVWLLDGTTSVHLGIVLAVLLLAGVVLEVLPTAKWGRTLGKRLLGLEVRDIEGHDAPGFGAALRRWLVYSVPGLLVVGVVGVLWCLFDKPWRQCWHDKAAHTFVAG
ncbi:RDD family protein [Streptomyces sp. NPDC051207]|uniref:RDD family protein n=1 Tax=Streptomyces sp. NPDC051207 TaxID=3154641 RepID=UPI00343B3E0A